jgi:hypothetical protein
VPTEVLSKFSSILGSIREEMMKRHIFLLLIIGVNSIALVAPQIASASGSKFYENVDELYDRPYAVGALSSAYACIKAPDVKSTTTTSTRELSQFPK